MAPERIRHINSVVAKRAKLWPVIGILGPRQSGKSTLLRNQIKNEGYLSLDSPSIRKAAEKAPELFIRSKLEEFGRLTVDEIQKCPDLFDTIKLIVDEGRRPGMFFISGSTQFSTKLGIRESLTGRIGLQRLYPLTAAECHQKPFVSPFVDLLQRKSMKHSHFSAVNVLQSAQLGGMPGFCFLRSEKERHDYLRGWLETTLYRDATQIRKPKPNPELMQAVIQHIGSHPFQSAHGIASALAEDTRRVVAQIQILEELFVICSLPASTVGVGKSLYFIFDSGFSYHLGSSALDAVRIWLINECLAQFEYADMSRPRMHYYQSRNGSLIDLVFPDFKTGIIITDEESPHEYRLRASKAFIHAHENWHIFILSPTSTARAESSQIKIVPWHHVC